eukprot:1189124-Prorocentrum_minimum.AAC.4
MRGWGIPPAAGANRKRGRGIALQLEPIARGAGARACAVGGETKAKSRVRKIGTGSAEDNRGGWFGRVKTPRQGGKGEKSLKWVRKWVRRTNKTDSMGLVPPMGRGGCSSDLRLSSATKHIPEVPMFIWRAVNSQRSVKPFSSRHHTDFVVRLSYRIVQFARARHVHSRFARARHGHRKIDRDDLFKPSSHSKSQFSHQFFTDAVYVRDVEP